MANNPVISLVVPVYGVEKYIADFARSVFGQSYPHVQFVFVNDGTKDASISVLKHVIESEYPGVKDRVVIVDKENGGLPAARKTGLEYATGDYIYHVDPDDWLSEGALEAIADCISVTDADFIYFNYVKEYDNRSSVKKENIYTSDQREVYIRNMYNHRAYGTLCNKCVRRSIYTDNKIFHPEYAYAEDCFLSVQLAGYAKTFAYLDRDIYHYRKTNPTSITRQGLQRRKREYVQNFLDLYVKYRNESHPVNVIFDDIVIQAGWYSILYGLNLYESHPCLAENICSARIRRNSNVWIPMQILVKIYSFFRNICRR